MKILVIEDGTSKLLSLSQALAHYSFDVAKSVNSGKKMIRAKKYELLIIDMNLPTFDLDAGEGGRIQSDGGSTLIRYATIHSPKSKTILFTQYDNLDLNGETITLDHINLELKEQYPSSYVGCVLFQSESDKWVSEIINMVEVAHENIDS